MKEAADEAQRQRAAAAEAVASAALGVAKSGPHIRVNHSNVSDAELGLDQTGSASIDTGMDLSGSLTPVTPSFAAFLEENKAFSPDIMQDLLREGWRPPSLADSRGN
eukprot:scaffold655964_cov41-Prasinocladus_malaysianus.AAC.1